MQFFQEKEAAQKDKITFWLQLEGGPVRERLRVLHQQKQAVFVSALDRLLMVYLVNYHHAYFSQRLGQKTAK